MSKRSVVAVLCALSLVVVAVPAFAGGAPDAAGLYKSKCAMCHGPDGSGQTTMGKSMKLRDLRSDEVQKQTAAELAKIISDGKGKMPSYKAKMSAEEINALADFIKDMKKK